MTCHLPIKFENTVYLHRSRLYMTTLSGCCVVQLNYLQLPIAVWNSFKPPYLPEKAGRHCYKYHTPSRCLGNRALQNDTLKVQFPADFPHYTTQGHKNSMLEGSWFYISKRFAGVVLLYGNVWLEKVKLICYGNQQGRLLQLHQHHFQCTVMPV